MALGMSSTTKAKIAAAALTALSAMSGSFSANAQQMAAAPSTPDFSRCDRMSTVNPKGAIVCRVEVLNTRAAAADARGAAADARGAAADVRAACANEIGELRRNTAFGDKATEIARELVRASGRPAREYDSCSLRDGIRAGLTRMKLIPARVSLN